MRPAAGSPFPLSGWQAVLFDLDGTLVDGRDAIVDAFAHALDATGLRPVPRAHVEALVGHPLDAMFLALAPQASRYDVPKLTEIYMARFAERAPTLLRLASGATEALASLRGTPIGIVTTKRRAAAELALRVVGVRDAFSAVVGLEDASHAKPHPAPVVEGARRLGVPAARCVVVGDTPLDVTAAKRAGAAAVGVLGGASERRALEAAGADVVLEDLHALPSALGRRLTL